MGVLEIFTDNTLDSSTSKLEAAGLSKISEYIGKYEAFATISGCRVFDDEAYRELGKDVEKHSRAKEFGFSKAENLVRHKELGQDLHRSKVKENLIEIDGCFQEGGALKPTLEKSYIVFGNDYNKLRDAMIKLGVKYSQDCVVVGRCTDDSKYGVKIYGELISTSPDYIDANGMSIGEVIEDYDSVHYGNRESGKEIENDDGTRERES